MSQNRRPPAYQEYAAEMLAQIPFRTMSLQDRGLLFTMRLECWVNKQLPNNPELIAKILSVSLDEVAASLKAVMPFFKIEGEYIICPELKDYQEHLDDRKRRQSEGGKTGVVITNEKRKAAKENAIDYTSTPSSNSSSNSSSTPSSNSSSNSSSTPTSTFQLPRQVPRQLPRQGSDESLVQSSTVKQSQVQLSVDSKYKQSCTHAYEAGENNSDDMVEF